MPADLLGILAPGLSPWLVERGIWSVLPPGTPPQPYDSRARLYDAVVGSTLYNRLVWGTSAGKYRRFAETAIQGDRRGWHLEAGCGSLVFSAEAYARHPERPAVLLDHSLGMLRRARDRIDRAPDRKAPRFLLQADLHALPFEPGVFDSVLSLGMLHLFADAGPTLRGLERVLAPSGTLFLSCLVVGHRWGDHYLRLLHRLGETARPRSAREVRQLVQEHLRRPIRLRQKGNMLFLEAGPP